MIEIIGAVLGEGFLRPWAGEGHALQQQQIDLVALPGQRSAIVGAGGQQAIDCSTVIAVDGLHGLAQQTPLMQTERLNPERHLTEALPERGVNAHADIGCLGARNQRCVLRHCGKWAWFGEDAPLLTGGTGVTNRHGQRFVGISGGFRDKRTPALKSIND